MNHLKSSKARYVLPNLITFLSLCCGVIAVMLLGSGDLALSGMFILASYILDLFDGEVARRLDAGSSFGLQLDSLVDIVSLGVAPAMLAFFHLQAEGGVSPYLLWPSIVVYVAGGAFRLARFNLLPVKAGQTDSVGLTISTAGATLTLAVLSDAANPDEVLANALFILFLWILTTLMISRISFPSITWLFSRWWANIIYVAYFILTLIVLRFSFFHVWFLFNSGYLGFTIMRAGYRILDD